MKPIHWAIGGTVLFFVLMVIVYCVSVSNSEVRLRNHIVAKQTDNTSEYDNMWKKISQVAQVTDAQKNALKDIFVSHAQARAVNSDKLLMAWVHETVPNVDTSTFNNLMNVITGSRDAWTMRQKELIDLKRVHDNMIDTFPSSMIVGGRGKIDIKVITSSKTEKVFEERKDDDVKVFN
jgi:hypothetical protein